MPRSTPRLPAASGGGSASLYRAATDEALVNALSGLGRATLVAFTRAEKAMWPTPPSVPAVPRTGLPPEITIPASGLKAFIASTAVLQAFSAGVVVAALHWGSPCAASGSIARPSRSAHNKKRRRSEEHTSELQYQIISYAVFCLKKKNKYKDERADKKDGSHHPALQQLSNVAVSGL